MGAYGVIANGKNMIILACVKNNKVCLWRWILLVTAIYCKMFNFILNGRIVQHVNPAPTKLFKNK